MRIILKQERRTGKDIQTAASCRFDSGFDSNFDSQFDSNFDSGFDSNFDSKFRLRSAGPQLPLATTLRPPRHRQTNTKNEGRSHHGLPRDKTNLCTKDTHARRNSRHFLLLRVIICLLHHLSIFFTPSSFLL